MTAAAAPQARPAARPDAAPPAPLVTRRLTKKYGDLVAVNQLDLEVRRGEIFGLLGQNGAGKTTTILMLLGLTEPTEGEARVVGLDPARSPREVKRRVGYLPDAVGFYDDMSGRANLRYTASLNGLSGRDAERAIDAVLDQVRLTSRGNDKVRTYSRGMRQRLGIADALVKDPDILILDEPTTAIDPIGVQEILELLQTLSRDQGLTILLSSHLLSQVQSVCDRVGIFAAGRLIGQGTVQELAARFIQDQATIEVEFHEDGDDAELAQRVEGALAALPSVTAVARSERVGRPWHVTVTPAAAEAEVREQIPAAAVAAGLRLIGLSPHVPSLDDIYRVALRRRAEERAARRAARAEKAAAGGIPTTSGDTPTTADKTAAARPTRHGRRSRRPRS
ncbi:MAG TPA: ABC transporter ATP-binding protein [Candidatus Limnocylindrales bacterium]|nr:ABC transporter ATP-binding protein [Candidatus Limnocylindrales bacterium]